VTELLSRGRLERSTAISEEVSTVLRLILDRPNYRKKKGEKEEDKISNHPGRKRAVQLGQMLLVETSKVGIKGSC